MEAINDEYVTRNHKHLKINFIIMPAKVNEIRQLIHMQIDLRIKSVLERILGKYLVKEFYQISASNNVLNLAGISTALQQAIIDNKIEIIKRINKVDGLLIIKDIQVEC